MKIRRKGITLPDSSFRAEVVACPSIIKDAAFYVMVAQFDPA